jgi:DnaJ-class molecular chaperone
MNEPLAKCPTCGMVRHTSKPCNYCHGRGVFRDEHGDGYTSCPACLGVGHD